MDKFCVNCMHYVAPKCRTPDDAHLGKCALFEKAEEVYMVTGVKELYFCTTARGTTKMCGPDANMFDDKTLVDLDERR